MNDVGLFSLEHFHVRTLSRQRNTVTATELLSRSPRGWCRLRRADAIIAGLWQSGARDDVIEHDIGVPRGSPRQ